MPTNFIIFDHLYYHCSKIYFNKFFKLTNFYRADPYFLKTEEVLRTTCLKLSMAETYLKPLLLDSAFIINVVTSHAAHIAYTENSNNQDFPWIVDDDFMEVVNGQLLPIKDISTNYLSLQLFVVEDRESKYH